MEPVSVVRDLGVFFWRRTVDARAYFTLGAAVLLPYASSIRSVRRQRGRDVTAKLVSAFVLSRLDYCNAVLSGLRVFLLRHWHLCKVLHAAAIVVLNLKPRDHVTPALSGVSCIAARLDYKLSSGSLLLLSLLLLLRSWWGNISPLKNQRTKSVVSSHVISVECSSVVFRSCLNRSTEDRSSVRFTWWRLFQSRGANWRRH